METKEREAEETAVNNENDVKKEVKTNDVELSNEYNEQSDPSGIDTEGEQDPEFIPQRIGDEDVNRANSAQRAYEQLIEAANELKPAIENSLNREITLDEFLEFLRNDPEKWLYTQYVKDNDINIPGISIEKIIEMRMLDISGIPKVLEKLKLFQSNIIPIKVSGFFYPLRKLYNEQMNEFAETGNFWEERDSRFSRFTETPEQNEILNIFKRLCGVLNELDELNIVRAKNGINEISMLDQYIEISKLSTIPFVVKSHLFYRPRLEKYRKKGFPSNSSSISDLFK